LNQLPEPEWIFPFDYMSIGESFFIPTLNTAEMLYAIECGAKRSKIKIKAYITTKENHLGVRVWLIA
jgi:hypothetical protein